MQEAQRPVLDAIEHNQKIMSQVANHIGQSYVNGRYSFIPPTYISDKNMPPPSLAAKSISITQTSEFSE